jgi:epsilon-lactone hydrolase
MLSLRAKATKRIMRATSSTKAYDVSQVVKLRRNFDRNLAIMFPSSGRNVRRQTIANVPIDIVEPKTATYRSIIYLHGGGFILGSPKSYRQHLKRLARLCEAKVFAVEYSLAPESLFPRALDEIQWVWKELTKDNLLDSKHTVFMGDSAGGNLALASLLRYRDLGLPLPSCVVLLSPFLDATFSGESHQSKVGIDPLLNHAKLELFVNSYLGKAAKEDPIVSPIFSDLRGLPPMLVHVGTDELLLSDSQGIMAHAKRDDVDATLFVGEGLWHGWHFFASYVPEAKRAMNNIAKFVKQYS